MLARPHPRPIRHLLVALVLIMQLPTLIAFSLLLLSQYQRLRDHVTDEMVDRARGIAVAVRERLQRVERQLETLGPTVPIDPAGLPALHARLLQAQRGGDFDAAALLARDGRQLLNTRVPYGQALPPALGPGLQPFSTGRASVIDVVKSPIADRWVAGLGVPVIQGNRIVYSLNATLDATQFRDLLQAQGLPPGWILAVIDNHGHIVARVPEHDSYVGRLVTADLQERIRMPPSTPSYEIFESRTLAGVDVVTAMRRSPVNGWTSLVSVPRAQLYAPIWRAGAWLLGGFLLVVAGSLWAASRVSGRITSSIERLRDAAARLPSGDGIEVGGLAFAEARELGGTIERAAREITEARDEVERVTHSFQRTLLAEIEARQIQVARELHDAVGSSLVGVQLMLGSARRSLGDGAGPLLDKAQEQLKLMARHVREISRGMMPAGSERGGLRAAIEQFALDLTDLKGVGCTLRARGDFTGIEPEAATHLYRIVQEATTNAIRHGQCKHIRITLASAGARMRLTIQDDGLGCEVEQISATHPGMGLRSMAARARAIDAQLEFGPPPVGGCRVRVTWSVAP